MPQDVLPHVRAGDKVVQVGPLSWKALKTLVDQFEKLNLPMPSLSADGIKERIASIEGSQVSLSDAIALAVQFVASNVDPLKAWTLRSPILAETLILGASNLEPAELELLTGAETVRVAKAAWSALVQDGFFAEIGGFFGELLGALFPASANTETPPAEPKDTAPPSS